MIFQVITDNGRRFIVQAPDETHARKRISEPQNYCYGWTGQTLDTEPGLTVRHVLPMPSHSNA